MTHPTPEPEFSSIPAEKVFKFAGKQLPTMKNIQFILSIVLLLAVGFLFWKIYNPEAAALPGNKDQVNQNLDAADQRGGLRIAYINTDSLVEKYHYHRELRDKLEKRAKALEQDLARKSETFQENVQVLQQQAEQMSDEQLQAAQLDLQQAQQRLMTYRDEKAEELANEEEELNKLIQEDMDVILDSIKQEMRLDFILSYDPGSILLKADEQYDITGEVVDRLNEKHQANLARKEQNKP